MAAQPGLPMAEQLPTDATARPKQAALPPGIGHAGVESWLMHNPSEDITTSCASALESLGRDA